MEKKCKCKRVIKGGMSTGLLLLFLMLSDCGMTSDVYFASQLFPSRPASWTMVNAEGEATFFQLRKVQNVGCTSGDSLDLFITKNASDTYWNPDIVNASVHWVMHQNSRGDWQAIASLIHWDNPNPAWGFGQNVTIDYISQTNAAYLVVPAFFSKNQRLTVTGYSQWYLDSDHQTTACLVNGEKGSLVRWTSKLYEQNVVTPIYSGPALVNEEFEGCSSSDQETDSSKACAHEKWYFAPNIGLVEIDSIWQGITLKRIANR